MVTGFTGSSPAEKLAGIKTDISEKLADKSAVTCVVGAGYVGLPLAEAFPKYLKII